MQYDLYIEHVEGAINRVADCLSRIADKLPESEVKHLKEAEDIINFPIVCILLNKQEYKRHVL